VESGKVVEFGSASQLQLCLRVGRYTGGTCRSGQPALPPPSLSHGKTQRTGWPYGLHGNDLDTSVSIARQYQRISSWRTSGLTLTAGNGLVNRTGYPGGS